MATVVDAPEPSEVNDFKFLQLRKVNLLSTSTGVPSDALNIVATSSRYGLIFVGVIGGFRVLKLENVLDLDDDKSSFRQAADNYSCHLIQSATPNLIALSSDDMTLAVSIEKDGRAVADMYDVRAFADTENMPLPFLTVQLSSEPAQLQDFMWNPVVVEKYAYCLNNGSLHVHEIADTSLNIVAGLPAQTGATSVCWSPKGKQLVVGKRDGSFSQYKPTLQEVKRIDGPKMSGTDVEVLNICWLTTTLFAVVYLPRSEDAAPCVVVVSTPKGAEITYTSFGEMCLASGENRKPRYLLYYQQEWGVLICASSNSVETAVIGGLNADKRNWTQWFLEGEGRADMPYDKKKETFPVGMSLIFCAQRKIVKSETEFYPPMPIIFILSTSGLLCPFHVLNIKPGCSSNVYPSEPIFVEGERKGKAQPAIPAPVPAAIPTPAPAAIPAPAPAAVLPPAPAAILPPAVLTPHSAPSNVLFRAPLSTGPMNNQQPPLPAATTMAKQKTSWFSSSPMFPTNTEPRPSFLSGKGDIPGSALAAQKNQVAFTPVSFMQNQEISSPTFPPRNVRPGAFPGFTLQAVPRPMTPPRQIPPSPQPQLFAPPSPAPALTSMPMMRNRPQPVQPVPPVQPVQVVPSVATPPAPTAMLPPSVDPIATATLAKNNSPSVKDDAYVSLIAEEIRKFEMQLMHLKESNSRTLLIGAQEEMAFIRKNSLLIEDFHKDLHEAMQSLNLDTHNLKTASLECFAMLGEANSRNIRRNDSKYMSMLRDRPLDPMTAKRMQKIKQLYQYLGTQLREVHDKLDRDRVEHAEKQKKKHKNQLRIPSSQAVYQTLVNNHNIIYNLKNRLDVVAKNFSRLKHMSATKGQLIDFNATSSIESELEKLADVLLDDKPSEKTEMKKKHERQKLPPKFQAALREVLSNRRITCVRPKVIQDATQSQLLSSPILHPQTRKTQKEAASPISEAQGVPSESAVPVITVAQQEPMATIGKGVVSISPQDGKALSAFTMKPGPQRVGGGITQGTPLARFMMPNPAEQMQYMPNRQLAYAYVPSNYQRPPRLVPVLLTKEDQSQMIDPSQVHVPSNARPVFFQVPPGSGVQGPHMGAFYPGYGYGRAAGPVPNRDASMIKLVTNSPPDGIPPMPKPVYEDISPVSSPHAANEDVFVQADVAASQMGKPVVGSPVMSPPGFMFGPSPLTQKYMSAVQPSSVFTVSSSKDGTAVVEKQFVEVETSCENSREAAPANVLFGQPTANFLNSSFAVPNTIVPSFPLSQKPGLDLSIGSNQSSSFTTADSVSQSSAVEEPVANSTVSVEGNMPATVEDVINNLGLDTNNVGGPLPSLHPASPESYQQVGAVTADSVKASQSDSTTAGFISQPAAGVLSPLATGVSSPPATGVSSPPASGVSSPSVSAATTTTTASIFGTPSFLGGRPIGSVTPFGGVSVPSASSTTTTSSFFGQSTASSGSFFGSVPRFGTVTSSSATATTAASVFGQSAASTPSFLSQPASTQSSFFNKPASVFGSATSQAAVTTSSGFSQPAPTLFGQTASPTTTTTSSIFSQPAASPFGQAASPTTTTTSSVFNKPASSPFGQTAPPATTTTNSVFIQPAASPFGQAASPTTTTASSLFNQPATSPFGQTTSPASPFTSTSTTPFGQTSSFGTTTAVSPFGQTTSPASPFSQTTSGFFNQTSQNATPTFGQKGNQGSTSLFGGQSSASGFTFGKPTFGQNSSNTFGLAKAVFGDSGNQQSGGFGQSQEQPLFGQGNLFSGIGGKPSEQNASKNVFGSVSGTQAASTNLFGNQGATSFGAKPPGFQTGSFSGSSGSVAQSGFGAFQQGTPKSGAFGASPSFGSPPSFGGSPSFGSSPTFGGGPTQNVVNNSPFGSGQASFSNFAAANAPTFGSLASQSGTFGSQQSPGFGQQQQQQQQQPQGNLFGGGGSVFGGGSSTFGGQQSGFGSPSGGNSAFSQWRN